MQLNDKFTDIDDLNMFYEHMFPTLPLRQIKQNYANFYQFCINMYLIYTGFQSLSSWRQYFKVIDVAFYDILHLFTFNLKQLDLYLK